VNIFVSHHEDLGRVGALIENIIRANSDIRVSILQRNANYTIDLDFAHSTGKNTLHCVLYNRDPIIKAVSDSLVDSASKRNIPNDYAKIDKRVTEPEFPTIYIKFGRENYEFDEALWASAVAEAIIAGLEGAKDIEDVKFYQKPVSQKTFYDRNFAQEPTRNSDLFKAE
jgi:hypothetical protein